MNLILLLFKIATKEIITKLCQSSTESYTSLSFVRRNDGAQMAKRALRDLYGCMDGRTRSW